MDFISFRDLRVVVVTVCCLGTAFTTDPSGASNGRIRGRVTLRRAAPPTERRPTVAELGAPAERDRPDRRQSVVYLEAAPRGAFEPSEPGRAVMDQLNETFVPHVLAVTTGTVVAFPNSDRIYHNVFSLSKAARFDLGRYAVGRSKSLRFDRPGIVRVFCDIHSHMNAFILVFSHPFFAITDVEGRYRIDNVPPGNYNVIAWNEGLFSEPTPATVPDGGDDGAGLRAPMKALSSLRSRIFLTSALLAVLSIGAAIYVVSARVTLEAENALQREILATRRARRAAPSDPRRNVHDDARGSSRTTRRLKAAVDTNDPATVQDVASEYQDQFKSNLLLVTNRSGGLLAAVGASPATAQTVARQPHGAGCDRRPRQFQPARATRRHAATRDGTDCGRVDQPGHSRDAERRVPARRCPRRAAQGDHGQRDRVRDGRPGSGHARSRPKTSPPSPISSSARINRRT